MTQGRSSGAVPARVPLRVVCAPDSFKHCMSAARAAAAMADGVHRVHPEADCVQVPMADGGEGFTDAIAASLGARVVEVSAHDALGRPTCGRLAVAGDLAAFEVASVVGLEAVAPADRNLLHSDTRGVGELLLAGLDAGVRRFLVGLGGSATNDGGAGMLAALGVRFRDAGGVPVPTTPEGLARLATVDLSGLDPRLAGCRVEVACDVDNPLLGARGASAVFGPQKGATPDQVVELDATLARLADASGTTAHAATPGAGAAGGLGHAFLAHLGADLRPGLRLVADAVGLAATIAGADLVLTGEGSLDGQTLAGKTPAGVVALARDAGVPVVVFAGRVSEDAGLLAALRADAVVCITPEGQDLPTALARGPQNLADAVARHLAVGGRDVGR